MTLRPIIVPWLAVIAILAPPAAAQSGTENYPTVSHDCAVAVPDGDTHSSHIPAPQWKDPRARAARGREQIVLEAARAAFAHVRKCGLDTWLGTIGQDRGTGLEPRVKHLADGSWLHYNKEVPRGGIHEFRTYPDSTLSFEAVLGDGAWSSITWTVEIRYVQVQRKHDVAARTTCVGKLDVLEARPQSDMPEQRYEHFLANIEVFPAVFERGEYLVPGEEDTQEPWARNPSEAIKLVLLHELGHLEAYASANAKMMTYHVTEDSEQTANDFASSVVRCQE